MQSSQLQQKAVSLVSNEAMEKAFKLIYARRIAEKDEFTAALWTRVHEHLVMGLNPTELQSMERIKSADLKELENILEIEIPNLRRKAAPTFNKKI